MMVLKKGKLKKWAKLNGVEIEAKKRTQKRVKGKNVLNVHKPLRSNWGATLPNSGNIPIRKAR